MASTLTAATTLPVMMAVMVATAGRQDGKLAAGKQLDRARGIGLARDKGLDAAAGQLLLQPRSHAAGDQGVDSVERMGLAIDHFVQALLAFQFDHARSADRRTFDLKQEKVAAHPGVRGDGPAVLCCQRDQCHVNS